MKYHLVEWLTLSAPPPYKYMQELGSGVVLKDVGPQIVYHQSAPASTSVNNGIDPIYWCLKYSPIDDALAEVRLLRYDS
jgi:hypothetical protein